VNAPAARKLHLSFHGRIIDSLGIQMYQSPVAAVAELIANAWDADARNVSVQLPGSISPTAELIVRDDGAGMTFEECQTRYLNVGRNRRLAEGERSPDGRPLLGRKGIGKFAGFGIARVVEIETTSASTGERTRFALDIDQLRSEGDPYVAGAREVEVRAADGPDESRRAEHGTTIRLRRLAFGHVPSPYSFTRSMARRFVLAQRAGEFAVTVNGSALPTEVDPIGNKTEFVFPDAYTTVERPEAMTLASDGWGVEEIAPDEVVEWQVTFTEKPIGEEELRGIAVYCGVKLAQAPFFFLLSGGLAGQHGQQYLTGRIRADYLDRLHDDIITTERQRINWENEAAGRLLAWGQKRLKELLILWQQRRADEKMKRVELKLVSFADRINRLNPSEAKTVRRALLRIAQIPAIDQPQFEELAGAILTAWEGGRLREIIDEVSRIETMDAGVLLTLLTEHQVLTALHVAESVKLKVDVVKGLRRRIEARELENAVRDYIAKNPWLISPKWETFKVERRIDHLVKDALNASGIASDVDWDGRVDLTLSSGSQLLVVEFMRPGLAIDRDHIDRFQRYADILRDRVMANTDLQFREVSGLLVADKLNKRPEDTRLLERIAREGMTCTEWRTLLAGTEAQWQEFLGALVERSPEDERVRALAAKKADAEGTLAAAPESEVGPI